MTADLSPIARPSGALAMVAMDQRDSLRTMFLDAGVTDVPDSLLVDFKLEVCRTLAPHGSAFLIDRDYGFDRVRDEQLLDEKVGLILAADVLEQEPTMPVEGTSLDAVVAQDTDMGGVDAIKLLLIWRRDDKREQRVQLAKDFIAAADRLGVLSVLEPVVRATEHELAEGSWDQEEAIREAARELSVLRPSLYKVQVPLGGKQTGEVLDREMALLDEAITGPWVVLSQGVTAEDFPGAVEAACRAGASGFLAGRALWADVVGMEGSLRENLEQVSVPRLKALGELVDRTATAWNEKH